MANTIRLKRASGSDPSASDLVVGEVALRTDTAKLFTKKDDNSIAEIGGSATVADDSISTAKIQDDAVTFAKIQNVSATNRILGRDSSGAGVIEEITPANLRTMLNVEDGATADQSASEILTLIKTVDGAGSGLDADTLDGISSASFLRSDQEDSSSAPLNINGGTADASNDATLFITATNNNDWGLRVDKFNGSATEYGIRLDVGSSANLAFQIRGSDSEVFRINGSGDVILSGTVDGRDVAADGTKLDGIASGATNVTNTNQLTNGAGFITATLTNEQVQDIVGGMVSGNTESGITVTYQDGDGTLDFSVASQTDNNFTTTLKNKLDGIASGATNVTNNNQISNGAGYITSADGGNAATLDGVDSSQFLRSDATDSSNSKVSFNGGIAVEDTCTSTITTLSDGSTVSPSFITSIHHVVTLGGNRTLSHQDTASAVGQCGSIFIVQDSSGSRTLSFNSAYKFASGTAPTLSTAANAVDRIDYIIRANDVIHCAFTADVK